MTLSTFGVGGIGSHCVVNVNGHGLSADEIAALSDVIVVGGLTDRLAAAQACLDYAHDREAFAEREFFLRLRGRILAWTDRLWAWVVGYVQQI